MFNIRALFVVVTSITFLAAPPAFAGKYHRGPAQAPAAQTQCLPGYHWYPDKQACMEYEPQNVGRPDKLVVREKCHPGDIKLVPNPARPGHQRILTCGYAPPADRVPNNRTLPDPVPVGESL